MRQSFRFPSLSRVALSACVFALSACTGWHLRGLVTLPTTLQPVAVEPQDNYAPLQNEFIQMLRDSHIALSDAQHPAALTVTLEGESFSSTPYTIGVDGQVKENKLTYQLRYHAEDARGHTLIATNSLTLTRLMPFDNNHVLSANSDADIQQSQLRMEALNQLMLRLTKAATIDLTPQPVPAKPQ